MTQTVLVTGANGFAGTHLCQKLAESGQRVRALVRSPEKAAHLKQYGVDLVQADLGRGPVPVPLLRGVETVYHLAAAYRSESRSHLDFYDTNLYGTHRLVQAAMRADVSRFVHCSTVGVLGHVTHSPANERTPYNPHDHYQKSKTEAEVLVRRLAQRGDLPATIVRPGAIYGPGDLRLLKLFRAVQRGLFWMVGPGQVCYHLVYVSDLVAGMMLAARHPDSVGEVFILAGEAPIQLWELVEQIGDALGRSVPRRSLPAAPVLAAARLTSRLSGAFGVQPLLYPRRLDFFLMNRAFDISKARRQLGYQPQVSLDQGLRLTADWYRAHGYL